MKIFAFRFRFDILNSLLQSYEKMVNSSKHFTYYIYANVYVVQESGASETLFFCIYLQMVTLHNTKIL
jgi:hypothetical protein